MESLGLAGKPNAGKSTFYQAATRADVDIANYPFTTIEPNRGVTYARTTCPCLDRDDRCDAPLCRDGKRYVPVELLDVAGLVPGAHQGRGLGNQFLDALMDADVILNVIDASGATNEEGEPVEPGSYDPRKEADFIETELDQWLTGIITNNWETIERRSRAPDFEFEEEITRILSGLGATESDITACLRTIEYDPDPIVWEDADRERLARELRRRTKPILLVANKVDIADDATLARLDDVDKPVIPATASGELALRSGEERGAIRYDPGDPSFEIVGEISDQQRSGLETIRRVMNAHGGTGVQRAIDTAVYDLLDHVTVFPVENESRWTDSSGTVLPDAVLLPTGSTPRDLAFAIHSDIGEGYHHAIDARTGRRIGDAHELEEGDVIKIVSTA